MGKVTTCTRCIYWCAGHRVFRHESKCAHLHGHQYIAEIEAQADELDDKGRVIDFGVLKEVIDTWVQEKWDHGFILNMDDGDAIAAMQFITDVDQKLYLLMCNPTAENIAKHLLETGNRLLGERQSRVRVVRVTVHETPNCYATYEDR